MDWTQGFIASTEETVLSTVSSGPGSVVGIATGYGLDSGFYC